MTSHLFFFFLNLLIYLPFFFLFLLTVTHLVCLPTPASSNTVKAGCASEEENERQLAKEKGAGPGMLCG